MSGVFDPGAAAAKNNENQQAAAVNNAQQAWANAAKTFNAWTAANPNPINATTVAKPTAGYQPQTQAIMQAPQMMTPPQMIGGPPTQQPHQAQLPTQMRSPQQAAASAPRPSPPPVNNAMVSAILGAT